MLCGPRLSGAQAPDVMGPACPPCPVPGNPCGIPAPSQQPREERACGIRRWFWGSLGRGTPHPCPSCIGQISDPQPPSITQGGGAGKCPEALVKSSQILPQCQEGEVEGPDHAGLGGRCQEFGCYCSCGGSWAEGCGGKWVAPPG